MRCNQHCSIRYEESKHTQRRRLSPHTHTHTHTHSFSPAAVEMLSPTQIRFSISPHRGALCLLDWLYVHVQNGNSRHNTLTRTSSGFLLSSSSWICARTMPRPVPRRRTGAAIPACAVINLSVCGQHELTQDWPHRRTHRRTYTRTHSEK